jgi:nucleotide-binding universal stress UspA family protein
MCFVDRGTSADDLALQTAERLADAIGAPLTAHPAPRPGAVDWPPGADEAAIAVAAAEQGVLAGLMNRTRTPELATRLCAPAVLVPEAAAEKPNPNGRGTLICGVDRSPAARSAAQTAAVLAGRLGSPLSLVHAQQPITATAIPMAGATAPMPALEEVDEEHREAGWELLQQIEQITPERARLRLMRRGRASRCLEEYAASQEAALIVVGAPHHGRLLGLLLGSTAWELARIAPAPVMYVPRDFVPRW